MAIELHGENFQSWPVFDLSIDGLTVVVGPSNIGKSAFARAIRALMRNLLNASQVRLGSDGTVIEAVIDGRKITARRGATKKSSVSYTIDGEDFSKLDGAIPDKVTELGMGELRIGSVRLDPVFAKQFGSQFLLEETPSALNTILGAFSSTEKLEAGKRAGNQKIAEKNSEAKVLAKLMRELEEKRAKLAVLAQKASEVEASIRQTEVELSQAEQIIEALDLLREHKTRLNTINSLLARFEIPDIDPVVKCVELAQAYTDAAKSKIRLRRIEDLLTRFVVPDISELLLLNEKAFYANKAATAMRRQAKATEAIKAIHLVVATWTELVEAYQKTKAFYAAAESLTAHRNSRAKAYLEKLDTKIETIERLRSEASELEAKTALLDSLLNHKRNLAAIEQEFPSVEAKLTAANTRLEELRAVQQAEEQARAVAEAQKKVAQTVSGTKACPKCGEILQSAA